jgi:uncharacterized protein YggT (Ycf19 family)
MIALLAQLLNFALALFFWLIIGRFVLQFLVGGRRNFFTELFRRGTDPLFRAVRWITPRFVGDGAIPWLTLLLLVVLRVLLLPLLLAG